MLPGNFLNENQSEQQGEKLSTTSKFSHENNLQKEHNPTPHEEYKEHDKHGYYHYYAVVHSNRYCCCI